ncbi:MAG: hypothetical protein II581_06335, partial [Oscillospiraceae bacterium]|nr:hypothetical protein [Oscillospiraceae bacterium]
MQGRKIVTLLISLLAASALWLYVVTSVAPEATARISDIPVTVDGSIVLEERGLIITEQQTESIWLELSSSRINLAKLNSSSIRIAADASKIRAEGTYELSYSEVATLDGHGFWHREDELVALHGTDESESYARVARS